MKDPADLARHPNARTILADAVSATPAPRADQATGEREPGHLNHLERTMNAPHHEPPGPRWQPFVRLGPPAPPPFPVDVLSPDLAAFVGAAADAEQVAPDIAATLVLGVVSAAAAWAPDGRSPTVAAGPMTEPLNLYCVAVEESGANKSGILRRALDPLEALERELREDPDHASERASQRANVDAATVRIGAIETAIKDAARAAASGKPWKGEDHATLTARLAEARTTLEELPRPSEPRLIADDATPEALVPLLADNPTILLATSEGHSVFALSTGRYGNGPNMDTLLRAWDRETIRVDRRTRDPLRAECPTLCLAIAVQPVVIRRLGDFEGDLNERGLTGRLLIAHPTTRIGHRHPPTGGGVARELLDAYARCIRRLFRIAAPADGTNATPMRLDAEARALFDDFYRQTETAMADGGPLAWIRSAASKMRSNLLRFAGILHLADGGSPGTPIPAAVVTRALALARYYLDHTQIAWSAMREPEDIAAARKLWTFVRRNARPVGDLDGARAITKRNLHAAAQGTFSTVADLDPPLSLLVAHGYLAVEERERTGPGRSPSPWVVVAPEAEAAR